MRNNCGLISVNTSIELVGVFNNFIKNVQTEVQSQQNKIEEQMIKNLPKYSLEDSENGYTQHFESQLTQKTKGFLIK